MKIEMHGISLPSPHEGEAFSQHTLIVPQSREAFERYVNAYSDGITWEVVRFVDFVNEEPFIVSTRDLSAEQLREVINFVIEVIDLPNERIRYFGSVVSFEELTPETVRVTWELEPFLTYRFYPALPDERKRISLSRAFVDRVQRTSPLIADHGLPDQPYAPLSMRVTKTQQFADNFCLVFVLTQRRHGDVYEAGPFYCSKSASSSHSLIEQLSQWPDEFLPSDISGAWVSPSGFGTDPDQPAGFTQSGLGLYEDYYWFTKDAELVSENTESSYDIPITGFDRPDEMHRLVLTDESGVILYEFEKHRPVPAHLRMRLLISASTCQVDIMFDPVPQDHPQVVRRAENLMCTYSCSSVDVILDQWAEYNARNRQTDIEMRKVQNDQRRAEGLSQVGNAALGGAVSGAITGNPLGIILGGLAGGAVSSAGTLATHAIGEKYGGRIQDITDRQYQLSQDTLILAGPSLFYKVNHIGVYIVELEGDSPSKHMMETDINGNGYHVSFFEPDGERLFEVSGPMRAQVMVTGEVTADIKQRISERIAQGVEVLRYV